MLQNMFTQKITILLGTEIKKAVIDRIIENYVVEE